MCYLRTGYRVQPRACYATPRTTFIFRQGVCWEIAIKYQLGKLPLPEHPDDFIGPRLLRDGIHGLQVSLQQATRVARLPMIHRDPFDRLLVSQSQIEKIVLISADPIFAQYNVQLIGC